jgi:tetratricopeptide (TPR) repeat protein
MTGPDMSVFDGRPANETYARVRRRVAAAVTALREDDDARPSRRQRRIATRAGSESGRFLAPRDEIAVGMRTAYVRVMLLSGRYRRVRRHLGPAVTVARQSLGTDCEQSRLLRACGTRAAEEVAPRHDRAVTAAQRRLEQAERGAGPASQEAMTAARRLAARYRKAFRLRDMAELYERTVAEARARLGDDHPRSSGFALEGAFACLATGETAAALRLFEYHYETEDSRLAEELSRHPGSVDARLERAQMWLALTEFLLAEGTVDRAERQARRLLRLVPELVAEAGAGEQMAWLGELEHQAHFALGNCLAAQDKWPEAHDSYRTAYQRLNPVDARNPLAVRYFTTVLFSGRRWTEY